jgi:hypothetical protein
MIVLGGWSLREISRTLLGFVAQLLTGLVADLDI